MEADQKIDFAPLDPARDAARWQRMIADVTMRAMAQRALSVPLLLARWSRPLFAVTAMLALVGGLGLWRVGRGASASTGDRRSSVLSKWEAGESPSTRTILELWGESNDT